MNTLRHYSKLILNIVIPVVALFLLLWLGPKLIVFFMPFIVGYILAHVANPLVAVLTEKLKIRRKAVSVFMIILVLGLIVLIGYGVGSILVHQIVGFVEDLPNMWVAVENELGKAGAHLSRLFNGLPKDMRVNVSDAGSKINDYISGIIGSVSSPTVNAIGNVAKHIPSILIGVIMCFLSAYFFIADKDYVGNALKKNVPEGMLLKWDLVYESLRKSVGGYFKAQLKIEVWMYLLLCVGLYLARVNYAALVALGIAFLDFFPILGTGTVLIPWAIIKILSGDFLPAIIMLALWGGGQLLRQIIQPKIMGDTIGMEPIPTLFLLFIGWKLGGVLGMIIALPLAMIVVNLNEEGIFDQAKKSFIYLVRDVNLFRKLSKDDEDYGKED